MYVTARVLLRRDGAKARVGGGDETGRREGANQKRGYSARFSNLHISPVTTTTRASPSSLLVSFRKNFGPAESKKLIPRRARLFFYFFLPSPSRSVAVPLSSRQSIIYFFPSRA